MIKRFLSIALTLAIIMGGTMAASAIPTLESKSEVLTINMDNVTYTDAKIQQLTESKMDLSNGVVMFYGRNLDVNKINNMFSLKNLMEDIQSHMRALHIRLKRRQI